MRNFAVWTLLLLLQLTAFGQATTTLRIDPANARGGSISELFDSVIFTPLETTKESLFGSVDQLEITDSFFIILDISGRSILIFEKNGKFRLRIQTASADTYFGYFALDRRNQIIIAKINGKDILLFYDLKGKFIKKESCPPDVISLRLFADNKIVYNLRRPFSAGDKPSTPYDLAYSAGYNSIVRKLNGYNDLVVDGEYNINSNPFSAAAKDESCMFSIPFDYKVYELADTGIVRTYMFLFPIDISLPKGFTTDSSFMSKRAEYVYTDDEHNKMVYSIQRTYRAGNYLLFSALDGQMRIGADLNYLYNLSTGSLLSFSRVRGDSTSYDIPLLGSVFEPLQGIYNNTLYSSMPSFRFLSYKGDKPQNYPPSLKEFVSKNNTHDNSVIVQFKLKPNL